MVDFSDKLKELMGTYVEGVKERVSNPLQTVATALKEGMPTEENPTGMFGAGGITRVAKTIVPEGVLTSRLARTDVGEVFRELKDGTWLSKEGTAYTQEELLKQFPTAYPIPMKEGPIQEGSWSQINTRKESSIERRKVTR